MKTLTSLQIDNLSLPGQYRDIESGLNYNFHRYYNPNLGRYIQSDPVFQPNNQLYTYARQNPQRFYDPLGLFEIDPSCNDCKFKDMWDDAQKACENASNNMSTSDFGAGSLKNCAKKYCKKAKIRCVDGDNEECEGSQGYTYGYGEFVICVDNTQDLNTTVTHEVCHLCDPDNQFNHGPDPSDEFEDNNRRWKRKGCPL